MNKNNIQADIADLLPSFSEIEEEIAQDPQKGARGETIVKGLEGKTGNWINVIPGGIPGKCCSTLVVAVGYNDDTEKCVLRASKQARNILLY